MVSSRVPVVLTIAGSDNSSGAGIQADLKTFSAFGCYGLTAVTSVVAEVPGLVVAIDPVDPQVVYEQIQLSLAHYPVAAIKTGMLYSGELVEMVATLLAGYKKKRGKQAPRLVVDPVMVATSGDKLLHDEAVEAYIKRLLPLADLVTPNLDELVVLAGRPVKTIEAMREAGAALVEKFQVPFLLKGGHLRSALATDLLLLPDERHFTYHAPYRRGVKTHGTGCTYSSAIAANLALGFPLPDAVQKAKDYISAAIYQSLRWKKMQALNHFPQIH